MQITKATLLLLSLATIASAADFHDHMKDAFDDIQAYWDGPGKTYNGTYYKELVQCLHKYDSKETYEAQVAAWKGIADYWLSNATNKDWRGRPDPWGATSPALYGDMPPFNEFYDRKNESIGRYNILTYEPCNYASNLAYYHSVTKICDYPDWTTSHEMQENQMRAMAALAVGSAFMHQSYTYVGARFDNLMISIISYLGHQMIVENLPYKSNQITYLQKDARSVTSTQLMENITATLAYRPVPDWGKALDTGDYPKDYFKNFGAIVCDVVALILPSYAANSLIKFIAPIVAPTTDSAQWIMNEYLPEILVAVKHINIPFHERMAVLSGLAGFLIKIGFAFSYQEQFLKIPGFQSAPAIWVGGHLVPQVYGLADGIAKFKQTDYNVNHSKNVYPGQEHCKYDQGHSIWHETSANGLLDLVYLCDYVNSLVVKYKNKHHSKYF